MKKRWFDDWHIEYGPRSDKYHFLVELPHAKSEKKRIEIDGYMTPEAYEKIKFIAICLDSALTELSKK